ncbi:TIGR02996 domain-containing protein [Gemmata sp.]|uniref:TIGR02996 domain-containing protein n=1 Tax=Gemmata sp. TaxID=1914242 RepID=UPI003F720816
MNPSADEAGFLAAICAAPDDDTPRLVYADWLQERGDEARAEFIRVQCELARAGGCHWPGEPTVGSAPWNPAREGLRRREYTLLDRRRELRGPAWGELATEWPRRARADGPESAERRPRATLRRGFIDEVWVEAPDWVRYAGPVAAAHPVRVVQLVGVQAFGLEDGMGCYWQREDAEESPYGFDTSILPAPLFDLLEGWRPGEHSAYIR